MPFVSHNTFLPILQQYEHKCGSSKYSVYQSISYISLTNKINNRDKWHDNMKLGANIELDCIVGKIAFFYLSNIVDNCQIIFNTL